MGCNNIGDEAILASVLAIFRQFFPDAAITVCTADAKTADLLDVSCAPLYGFDPAHDLADFARLAARHDLYCWCGATGLSDYPDVALKLLQSAQEQEVPTIVWCVGMDEQFNPAHFKVAGKKKMLLSLASLLSLRRIDFALLYEQWLIKRVYARINACLTACRLVVLRDQASLRCLEKSGFRRAIYAADSAICQTSAACSPIGASPGIYKVGFCVSAQRKIVNEQALVDLWKDLQSKGYHIVFIPMNPVTDRELMRRLSTSLNQQQVEWVNSSLPAEVQAAAANCDVVVSSRLHLLILAANARTPIIGIGRGSKIDNFLEQFSLSPAGNFENCDFAKIGNEIERFRQGGDKEFKTIASKVYSEMHERLTSAKQLLQDEINSILSSKVKN